MFLPCVYGGPSDDNVVEHEHDCVMLIFSIETLQDKRQKVSNMFCSYNGRLLVGTVHLGNIISV